MAGRKQLINITGHDLEVTLIVRKGDHPQETAGTVIVELAGLPEEDGKGDDRAKMVDYGNDIDIYLNGIEMKMTSKGKEVAQRRVILERGVGLDNELNMNDTIQFIYDGDNVLIATSNSSDKPYEFTPEEE
jgi:hypothetical protein